MVFAIDPGNILSGYCILDGFSILDFGKIENPPLLQKIEAFSPEEKTKYSFVCEWIESYGMPVGQEVFHTCRWCGIFEHAWGKNVSFLSRLQVKLALCHNVKVNDAIIRRRVLDIYGPDKSKAVGVKKSPGPLYGVKADVWQALALGLAFQEIKSNGYFLAPKAVGENTINAI